jgi:FkbM family methyltransferase
MKTLIKRVLRKFGYEISAVSPPKAPPDQPLSCVQVDVLDLAIRREMQRNPDWFFIQIGAHDGASYDPINKYVREFNWRGIVVEPQPSIFSRLAKTYEGAAQVRLENVAIGKEDGFASLYAFKQDPNLPYHATMLASFARAALEKNGHGYKGEIEELKVPTLSVQTLLRKHSVSRVDLLQIDTEGFDKEIIRMFVEADCWPTIIHFEDVVGLRKSNDSCLAPLIAKGYAFFHLWPDTLAYRQADDDQFRRRTTATQADLDALLPPK